MDYRGIEEDTIFWLNKARTNPQSLLADLKEMLGYFSDLQYKDPVTSICVLTNEVNNDEPGQGCSVRSDSLSQDY